MPPVRREGLAVANEPHDATSGPPSQEGSQVKLDTLSRAIGEWLRGTGPESDIVMSSRVRLARNVAHYPFVSRASETERGEIEQFLREQVAVSPAGGGLEYIDVGHLEEVDRQFLVERQLISREHAEAEGARGVAIDGREQVSLMINEEDHLRIQCMHSGLDLAGAFEQIRRVDERIEEVVPYAFHPRWGYLTACPTNVGTGIRVSVMLHLPALVITRQIDKVFRSLHKIHLAVRGLYGEGSQATGDFYQISNQTTLGKTEEDLISQVGDVVPVLIEYERKARDYLIKETELNIHDQVSRAIGILRTAQTISAEETMQHLSRVRMGVFLGLLGDVKISDINALLVRTQPAHLQKLRGIELDSNDRNIERARYLRQYFENAETGGTSVN